MPLTGEAKRAYNAQYRKRNGSYQNYKKRAARKTLPFVAIDSEGVSHGEKVEMPNGDLAQRQRTVFWGAGSVEKEPIFLDGSPFCETEEIIDWLLDLPKHFGPSIFVWFGSSYDATQIFCDLPYEKAWELQRGEAFEKTSEHSRKRNGRYVLWKQWALSYIKQKCLKICELDNPHRPRDPKSGNFKFKRQIIIYDIFGFFQTSFLKAAGSIPGAMTEKEKAIIEEGKKSRHDFSLGNRAEMQRYTAAELVVMARMMEGLRSSLNDYDLKLTRWQGAGSIAGALFNLHGAKEHFAPLATCDLPIEQEWAHRAFFGGRIECLKQGRTSQQLYSYDIRSAYPYHMSRLPSMKGGEFRYVEKPTREMVEKASPLSMFKVRFECRTDDGPLALNKIYGAKGPEFYPLPYRDDSGRIVYPPVAHGIYMAEEVKAALEWTRVFSAHYEQASRNSFTLPAELEVEAGLIFDHLGGNSPFNWLEEMYLERRTIVSRSKRTGIYDLTEKVIKLGINSVYGKTAQSVGSAGQAPSTACPWIAAAITAGTRAQLLRAALTAPAGSIVAFQTDGIVSTRPLKIQEGEKLGQWEGVKVGGPDAAPSIFVQPGVYFFDEKSKHRGIKLDLLGVDKFENWLEANAIPAWREGRNSVEYPYRYYVTLGAAVASRERWKFAGYWVDGKRELALDNLGFKRAAPLLAAEKKARADRLIDTLPKPAFYHKPEIDPRDLPLSAIYKPEWLDAEFAADMELEKLNEEIALARE